MLETFSQDLSLSLVPEQGTLCLAVILRENSERELRSAVAWGGRAVRVVALRWSAISRAGGFPVRPPLYWLHTSHWLVIKGTQKHGAGWWGRQSLSKQIEQGTAGMHKSRGEAGDVAQ